MHSIPTTLLVSCVLASSSQSLPSLREICEAAHSSDDLMSTSRLNEVLDFVYGPSWPKHKSLYDLAHHYLRYLTLPLRFNQKFNLYYGEEETILKERLRNDCAQWPNPEEDYCKYYPDYDCKAFTQSSLESTINSETPNEASSSPSPTLSQSGPQFIALSSAPTLTPTPTVPVPSPTVSQPVAGTVPV